MKVENRNDFEKLLESYKQALQLGLSGKNLVLKESSIPNAGLGIFAAVDFEVQDLIEFCHCIVLDWRRKYLREPRIDQYAYSPSCQCEECKRHGNQVVLPLGYGMIYNSAESQEAANCGFAIIPQHRMMAFIALKPIKAGEEILTWWGQNYYDKWCSPNKTEEHKNEDKKEQ